MSHGGDLDRNDVYTRKVIFRLLEFITVDSPERTVELIEADALGSWSRLVDTFPGIYNRPRWKASGWTQIRELLERAWEVNPRYRPGPVLHYFEVVWPIRRADCRRGAARSLVERGS